MNKLLLSFAIASALGLAGCGGETLDEIKDNTQTVVRFKSLYHV